MSYSLDEVARLSSVKDTTDPQTPKTYISSLSYAAHGGMLGATLGNGSIETVGYNNRLQPTSLVLSKAGNTLQRYDYKYGQVDQNTGAVDETKNNGQIGRIEGYIGSTRQWQQRYSYDSLGRLSTAGEYLGDATLALTHQSNYSYDRWGNRKQKAAQNSQSLSYTQIEDADIDPATNRLTSNTTYDAIGNVEVDQKFRGMQYKYDANGRMWKSANIDNSGQATSVYDALGQRVQTTAGGNTKTMVYDVFGRMVAEYDSQAQGGAGGTKYIMSDVQGSARVITSNNGSVMARHDYQAFGGEIGANVGLRTPGQKYDVSDSTRQKYALTERDGTGLDHTWWRKYESSAGRWTSPDPYNGSMTIGNPQSFNRYSYLQNDPANFVDPTGLCTFNVNISGVSGEVLTDMQNEIRRIFATGHHSVVFGRPSLANGGSMNIFVVDQFTGAALDTLKGLDPADAAGVFVPGTHDGYVNRTNIDRENKMFLILIGARPSIGTLYGIVGAHEVIQHGFLGRNEGRTEDISKSGDIQALTQPGRWDLNSESANALSNLCLSPIEQRPLNINTNPIPLRPLIARPEGTGSGYGGFYPPWWNSLVAFLNWVNSTPIGRRRKDDRRY